MGEKYYRILNMTNKKAWLMEEKLIENYIKNKTALCVSTYYYNKEHYKKFKETNSVAGITDVKTNQLWFDFDSEDNVDLAKKDALNLVNLLESKGFKEENLKIYYSGNRGFHVLVKLNTELTRKQVENTISKLQKNLPTLDMSMYDWNQVLRGQNTKHEATGLYKIQLFKTELNEYSVDQIKQLAIEPRDFSKYPTLAATLPKELLIEEEKQTKLGQELLKGLKEANSINDPLKIKEIDFTQRPVGWPEYKWSLAQGRFEVGTRNKSMMTIAATCRALKYGEAHTTAICRAADELHCEITKDSPMNDNDLENQVLKVVFSESWQGGQYSAENDLELRKYCEKYGFDLKNDKDFDIMTIGEVNSTFKDFVVNIDKNTIKTGIKKLDEMVPITIGMNLGLIGAASSGKTAIALEILKNTSMNGVVSVIASLDMHRNRLFEKLLYKVSQTVYKKTLSRAELYAKYQNDEESLLVAEIKKQFGNVYFYDRSRPTVSDLKIFVQQIERQTGQKVKLLLVDYFERIGSDIPDATASSLKVAGELQDLINDLNVAVITLVQPNKFSLSGGPDCPILNYTAIKGSSFLYQSFRAIVSIWRPFFNPKMSDLDKFLEMAILKNDLGELETFKFNWEGKTGSITGMTEENEFTYNEFMKERAQRKNVDKPESDTFGQFRR